ncbi:MAG TPA: Uma2 family endonuclease [Actinocrinis sp.]|nr:Uma2 family endonuclease [Actinocrinis sp.]
MTDRIGRRDAAEERAWDEMTYWEGHAIPYWIWENVTADMWQAMPETLCSRMEIVDGRALLLASPTIDHQGAAGMLNLELRSHARAYAQASCRAIDALYGYALRLRDRPLHHRRPDVIVYELAPGRNLPAPSDTLLVVEVVSQSSRIMDTVHKSAEYADAGIANYWIVETSDGSISNVTWYALPKHEKRYEVRACWTPAETPEGISTDEPFPIRIAWDELAF